MSASAEARAMVDAHEAVAALGDRRAKGVYYTPSEVVVAAINAALDTALAAAGDVSALTTLDPAAGAGAFLLGVHAALAERSSSLGVKRPLAQALAGLHGVDLDGAALDVAWRALLVQAAPDEPTAREQEALRARLVVGDALHGDAPRAHLVVGNPPYGRAAADERDRLAARFPELGGEVDRACAFSLRALELCRPGGALALVVPDTWLTSKAGRGLRAALASRATVLGVHDLGKPFRTAKDTRVHVLAARSSVGGGAARVTSLGVPLREVSQAVLRETAARGWWLYRTDAEEALCARVATLPTLGASREVIYGLRTGDNARYVSRTAGVAQLVGGEDVEPYALRVKPKWLVEFAKEHATNARRQRGPRVAVQRIRTNSARPSARWLEAAPVLDGALCLDSLTAIAAHDVADAHALTAWLCSAPVNRVYKLHFTDVNVRPATLSTLPLPALTPRLATLGAALATATGARATALQREADAEVYRLLGCDAAETETLERGWWGAGPRPELPSV